MIVGKSSASVLILGVLIFSCFAAFSQSEYGGFENLGKDDGLYTKNTTCLFHDSKGFLWVGTRDGLMRYDGAYFDVFRKTQGDSTSLSDNSITCIIEEKDDYVFWIGTEWGGINRFDIARNSFENFQVNPQSVVRTKRISCIHQLNNDTLLVGTAFNGLYYFYPSSGVFEHAEVPNVSKKIYDIVEGAHCLWVVNSEGLVCLDKEKGRVDHHCLVNEDIRRRLGKKGSAYSKIRGVLENSNGDVLFTAGHSLYEINRESFDICELMSVEQGIVFKNLVKDDKGNYWISSIKDGMFYYDAENKKVANYRHDELLPNNSLSNNEIRDLLWVKDQDVMFVATRNGLSKYDYHKEIFKQFEIRKLTDCNFSDVRIVFKDLQGTYWFSSVTGKLYRKRVNDQRFEYFKVNKKMYLYQAFHSDSSNIWFVSNCGLYHYNLSSGKQELIQFEYPGISRALLNHLQAGLFSEEGKIWLVSRGAIIRFDPGTGDYNVYNSNFKEVKGLHKYVSLNLTDDGKYLWFAERTGILFRFDLKTKTLESIHPDFHEMDLRRTNLIVDTELDEEGRVWIATNGAGLMIYEPQTQRLVDKLAIEDLESYVHGIVYDNNGYMWISSNFGITKVNARDFTYSTFEPKEGSLLGEFNHRVYFRSNDGNVLFGGPQGFIEFNPSEVYQNRFDGPPVINAWAYENLSSELLGEMHEDINYVNDTVLKFKRVKNSDVIFYASVLSYSHSERNNIKWKLDGLRNDWNQTDASEPIKFNNLKPGKYILRVIGINNHGIESKQESRLHIEVVPGFYETLLFKMLIALSILMVMYFIFKLRIAWYHNQKKILVHTVKEKTLELTVANEKLENTQEKILKQNTELGLHRNYLEELVDIRTQDLEIAKQKAEESDRLKTAFLANLSHEIRTPMNAIIGFSTLIQTDEFDERQKKEFVKVIGQSSESLLSLIDDIIDISRIETGNLKIVYQDVNVNDLIKETLSELVFEEKSERVEFVEEFLLPEEHEMIIADKQRLKQILSNLLRNAFKFTSEGFVKLTVKNASENELVDIGFDLNASAKENLSPVLFVIEDTGIGIDKEDIKVVFQPFQKASKNNELFKGMGLGLSIVKNLVVLFGGDIIVKSELQKGTKFYFYINSIPVTSS